MKIDGNTAIFENKETNENSFYSLEYTVLDLGTKPDTELIEEIKEEFSNVFVLGDANKTGRIRNAMETGFELAYKL
ncbi:hypothetical protein [Tepidimicrobium xylanilyticum]|uniref:Uncharacterized protein n=1 Tax=Tepidimicrobium xylanilyticum TaxID=1123352 RepID=A0A1H2WBW3_9FIRM|nr:hypothetical protein [Tepidimicrobium xylanilyticum]GMG95291.1 hypothetical protein EN5CB1_01170 [Tepidimicrobium xylanilyticum]SDW77774.1 hypothetical protein SAMN05660923_01209 [Tepidimicrobium xylanilyticum]